MAALCALGSCGTMVPSLAALRRVHEFILGRFSICNWLTRTASLNGWHAELFGASGDKLH